MLSNGDQTLDNQNPVENISVEAPAHMPFPFYKVSRSLNSLECKLQIFIIPSTVHVLLLPIFATDTCAHNT